MKENWYALYLAIIKSYSCEKALIHMGKNTSKGPYVKIDENDLKYMLRLHEQGYSYNKIGEIYGLSSSAAYERIKKYNKKDKRY